MATTKTKTKAGARPATMTTAPAGNLPAAIDPRAVAPPTKAQAQREKIESWMQEVQVRMPDLLPFLQQSRVPPDLFLAGCKRAFIRDPKLLDCTIASFIQAVMDCAKVGLLPDGKKAAIVPFNDYKTKTTVATLIVMYQGFLDVIYRANQIDTVHAQVIYEGEDAPEYLDYDLGSDPFVKFRPPLSRDDSKPIIGAFAHAHPKGGGTPWVELMGAKELRKVGAVNKANNGPGKDWPGEMARKAPLRRLVKFLPQSPELNLLLEIDDKSYLDKPEARAENPRALTSAQLLGDKAYIPPPADDEDGQDERSDFTDADHEMIEGMVGTAIDEAVAADPHATATLEDMLRSAAAHKDPEILAARLKLVQGVDYGWRELSAEDKLRVSLVYAELLAEMNQPLGDLGKPLDPPKHFAVGIRTRKGIETFRDYDEWKYTMLAALGDASRVTVLNFWSQNLETVEEMCAAVPNAAGPVVLKALTLGLKRSPDLNAKYGPFNG